MSWVRSNKLCSILYYSGKLVRLRRHVMLRMGVTGGFASGSSGSVAQPCDTSPSSSTGHPTGAVPGSSRSPVCKRLPRGRFTWGLASRTRVDTQWGCTLSGALLWRRRRLHQSVQHSVQLQSSHNRVRIVMPSMTSGARLVDGGSVDWGEGTEALNVQST